MLTGRQGRYLKIQLHYVTCCYNTLFIYSLKVFSVFTVLSQTDAADLVLYSYCILPFLILLLPDNRNSQYRVPLLVLTGSCNRVFLQCHLWQRVVIRSGSVAVQSCCLLSVVQSGSPVVQSCCLVGQSCLDSSTVAGDVCCWLNSVLTPVFISASGRGRQMLRSQQP